MIRRVRLITGLILFAFVTGHLINHILGIHSLAAMEAGREWFVMIWRNPAGSIAFGGALLVHLLLAVWALYSRRSLRMSCGEALQITLGFSIPLFLALHFVGTGGVHRIFGANDSYAFVLLAIWKFSDTSVFTQSAGLLATWVHGCIGLYFWLRLKPIFETFKPVLFAFAVAIPIASWIGFYAGGKEVLSLYEDIDWRRAAIASFKAPNADGVHLVYELSYFIRSTIFGLIGLALIGRLTRSIMERRKGTYLLQYPNNIVFRNVTGTTILEASRLHGIPHASVCGGRGRCSTCRVRVLEGEEKLGEPKAEELRVLERVGAPPRVRLACQAVPSGDISIIPLLPANATVKDARRRSPDMAGQEREISILFADLRSFTQFSEKKLPYDVVFVLNRYFAHMGEAIESSGGHLDKFIGDGVMALFGTSSDGKSGARDALEAAQSMSQKLADLNSQLHDELDEPLRIGIGIHSGPAIIGEMGYGTAFGLTAIGDSVNTASRLEAMTKEYAAELVFSNDVAEKAEINVTGIPQNETDIRGRKDPVKFYVIENAANGLSTCFSS
ncbi:MAG: Adenylate cyclase 1 [Alphaproteobacteria bacterium MarineAlpha11_Bin1]|nr:MAG: Adenylate cyclase 1 [Alphaproteobacteria bacterium MarineAlpha11_Bin1]|tara:strand:+ start:4209 stop:5879 length:1671 start_codon:yes stop_codon:yes gene_type:complete